MATAGLYDDSGKWLYHTGLPARAASAAGSSPCRPASSGSRPRLPIGRDGRYLLLILCRGDDEDRSGLQPQRDVFLRLPGATDSLLPAFSDTVACFTLSGLVDVSAIVASLAVTSAASCGASVTAWVAFTFTAVIRSRRAARSALSVVTLVCCFWGVTVVSCGASVGQQRRRADAADAQGEHVLPLLRRGSSGLRLGRVVADAEPLRRRQPRRHGPALDRSRPCRAFCRCPRRTASPPAGTARPARSGRSRCCSRAARPSPANRRS